MKPLIICAILLGSCAGGDDSASDGPNQPPELISYTDGSSLCDGVDLGGVTDPLCLGEDGEQVQVVATDPDDDPLLFYWSDSVSGELESTEGAMGDEHASWITVSITDLAAGETLTCRISDGPEEVEVSWTILAAE